MIRASILVREGFLTRLGTVTRKTKTPYFKRKTSLTPKQKKRILRYGKKPKPMEPLKFPLQPLPKSDKPSGWLEPLGNTEHLPFKVFRTKSHQLPVYTDFKYGGARVITILRKYAGNTKELKEELSRLLGGAEILERPGRFEVKGNYVSDIKLWLKKLGF